MSFLVNPFFVVHLAFHPKTFQDEEGVVHVPRDHTNIHWLGIPYMVGMDGRLSEEPFTMDYETLS